MHRRGLIVDDETAVCEMVGKVLTSAGIEAMTLTKSIDAPGLFNEGKFDVVFLDLHMAAPLNVDMHLSRSAGLLVGVCSVARVLGSNQMGFQLDQLYAGESERL